MVKRHVPDKIDVLSMQIAVFQGAEWPVQSIADHLGVTRQAVYQHIKRHEAYIATLSGFTKVAVDRYVSERVKQLEEDFKERKTRIHEKGYKVIEKKLNIALKDENDELDLSDLRAAEMGIERTEGKPLDRKAILERTEHVVIHEVDGDDLNGLLGEVAKLNELRRKALPAFAEAELVPIDK